MHVHVVLLILGTFSCLSIVLNFRFIGFKILLVIFDNSISDL